MKCQNCGTEAFTASKFCFKCGAEIQKIEDVADSNLKEEKIESNAEKKEQKKKENKSTKDNKKGEHNEGSFVARNYNTIFLSSMTAMLIALMIWAFMTAK